MWDLEWFQSLFYRLAWASILVNWWVKGSPTRQKCWFYNGQDKQSLSMLSSMDYLATTGPFVWQLWHQLFQVPGEVYLDSPVSGSFWLIKWKVLFCACSCCSWVRCSLLLPVWCQRGAGALQQHGDGVSRPVSYTSNKFKRYQLHHWEVIVIWMFMLVPVLHLLYTLIEYPQVSRVLIKTQIKGWRNGYCCRIRDIKMLWWC